MARHAMKDKNICARKECTFYGDLQKGTCNYRPITGSGRGCPVAGCIRFTTEPFKDRRKQITLNPPAKNPDTEKQKGAKKEMAKSYDWMAIFGRLSAGEDYGKVQAEHGFSDAAYHYQIRKQKAGGSHEGGAEGAPLPANADGPEAPPAEMADTGETLRANAGNPTEDVERTTVTKIKLKGGKKYAAQLKKIRGEYRKLQRAIDGVNEAIYEFTHLR